ncbi:MAG: LAGLIDADG family homing endonuclease [bacterium]|nr:LAGLIDADG family homing endonuclease [bacterium]
MQEVSRSHSTSTEVEGRGEPSNKKALSPWYVVGFTDGEGSFSVSITHHRTLKTRVEISPDFSIELRKDDEEILTRIQSLLGVGKIYYVRFRNEAWQDHAKLKVRSVKELHEVVIPFFRTYPLQAKKAKVFEIFATIVEMMVRKEHLTYGGIQKIKKLREQMQIFGKKYRN